MTTDSRYRDLDLWIPENFHTEFVKSSRLVKRGDDSFVAFNRQIDLWWYALGVGIRIGARTPLPDRPLLVRFNDGGILESEPWRITHLELLALAERGEETASNPAKVLQYAHEYTMTGFDFLTQELRGKIDLQLHLLNLTTNA